MVLNINVLPNNLRFHLQEKKATESGKSHREPTVQECDATETQ